MGSSAVVAHSYWRRLYLKFMIDNNFSQQGAHHIRKSLIYSTRKAFLEKAVVELDYKFDEKSYRECLKM